MKSSLDSHGFSIRPTITSDLDDVMKIYDHARKKMRASGNLTQWVNGYPSREIIAGDIASGNSYVILKENHIQGVFTFIVGEDPTYSVIEGAWPDNNPYGTIHRIASAPDTKGIGDACLEFCLHRGIGIRVDTHADNAPMLCWIKSRGFHYCGVIHIADGSPREAFQLSRNFVI